MTAAATITDSGAVRGAPDAGREVRRVSAVDGGGQPPAPAVDTHPTAVARLWRHIVGPRRISRAALLSQLAAEQVRAERAEARAREAEHRLWHDELTGLLSRKGLTDWWPRIAPVAVILADLDGFKAVNDRYGHAAGDTVLAEMGRRLVAPATGARGVRLHGDELVVVLTAACHHSATAAMGIARQVSDAIAAPVTVAGTRRVTVTASVGVTLVQPGEPLREVLRRADVAMYTAKVQFSQPVLWRDGLGWPAVQPGDRRTVRRTT